MVRTLLTVALCGTLAAAPQDPGVPSSPPAPAFSASTQLVVLHVNVQDRRGGFVSDLPAEAFAVLEEGRPQRVSLFLREDGPATVGLVIDNSASMFAQRELVIEAAAAFAKAARPDDQLFAIAFNEHVRPVLDRSAPFTDDPVLFESALSKAIFARGRTAFFDAVIMGLDYLKLGAHQRKVLIIIGDGGDNESTHTFDEVLREAQASNVLLYTVALVDPVDRTANPKRLEELARATGGQRLTPASRRGVYDVLQRIAEDIRHTYTLGYDPDRPADGSFRSVSVRVTAPRDVRPIVRTRAGYLASRPAPTEGAPRDDLR